MIAARRKNGGKVSKVRGIDAGTEARLAGNEPRPFRAPTRSAWNASATRDNNQQCSAGTLLALQTPTRRPCHDYDLDEYSFRKVSGGLREIAANDGVVTVC